MVRSVSRVCCRFVLPAAALALQALPVAAQESFINFDQGCRPVVFERASGGGPGTLTNNMPGPAFAPGRWGEALRGLDAPPATFLEQRSAASSVRHSGDFTMALWIRERLDFRSLSFPFDSTLTFGVHKLELLNFSPSNVSRLQIQVFGSSSSSGNTLLPDLGARARGRWLHVAVVADAAAQTLTLYLDGSLEATVPAIAPIPAVSGSIQVGQVPREVCLHDIDEFFFSARRLTAAEIMQLATAPAAGVARLGSGCNLGLSITGGPPKHGATLDLRVTDQRPVASNNQVLTIGFGNGLCSLNGFALPYDLGGIVPSLSGCQLWSSMNLLTIATTLAPGGTVSYPISVPASAANVFLTVQALAVDPAALQISSSDAWALAIGNS